MKAALTNAAENWTTTTGSWVQHIGKRAPLSWHLMCSKHAGAARACSSAMHSERLVSTEQHLAREGERTALFQIPGFDIWRVRLGVACVVTWPVAWFVVCACEAALLCRLRGVQVLLSTDCAQHQLAMIKGFSLTFFTHLTWESSQSEFPLCSARCAGAVCCNRSLCGVHLA